MARTTKHRTHGRDTLPHLTSPYKGEEKRTKPTRGGDLRIPFSSLVVQAANLHEGLYYNRTRLGFHPNWVRVSLIW